MYDLVGNTFYGNSGTGTFLTGGSTQVIAANGTINSSVSGWTASDKKWLITADKTLVARCTPNYTVTFDKNINLLYGLYNTTEIVASYNKYSINNGVITVTATKDDGYGFTTGRVYLEANKTYTFNSITN